MTTFTNAAIDKLLIDTAAGKGSQDYRLTNTYRIDKHAVEYTVRVRIRVDSYEQQSHAVVEVLTPALTWTELATQPTDTWYEGVASPYAQDLNPGKELTPLARRLFDRAHNILP